MVPRALPNAVSYSTAFNILSWRRALGLSTMAQHRLRANEVPLAFDRTSDTNMLHPIEIKRYMRSVYTYRYTGIYLHTKYIYIYESYDQFLQ